MQKKSYEVELRGNTKVYRAEFGRAIKTNDTFNKSVKGIAQGATAIQGPMGGVASRITVLNGLFTSGNIALAGFTAGLATLTAGAYKSLKVFDEYQRGQLKTEALVKATGNAAGLSAEQLQDHANEVALNTLASVGGIVEAQNVLQTFKTVSGDTFKQAIVLSQDMAAVFGGSAKDKAVQLGKALEDPLKGITALNKSGVTFSETQKDMIRSMVDVGDTASAQKIILRQVAEQVAGAGSGEAGGLSGTVDTLSQRWDELLLSWSKTSGTASTVTSWIGSITGGLVALKESIDPSLSTLEIKLKNLEAAQNKRKRGSGAKVNDSEDNNSPSKRIKELKKEILEFKASKGDATAINALIKQTNDDISSIEQNLPTASTEERSGQMGRNGTEADKLNSQKEKLEASLSQYKAQLAAINEAEKQHAETQSKLTADAKAAAQISLDEKNEKEAKKQALLDAQNERQIETINRKFENIHAAALAAENKDIELETLRYERKLAELERDIELATEKGLLTEELTLGHQQAIENLEREHQANLGSIRKEANDKLLQDEADKNSQMVEGYGYLFDALSGFLGGMEGKEAHYAKTAIAMGSTLLDDKKQKALQSIWTNTSDAAMGAYNAMSGIPYIGPALGIAAKGAVYIAGGVAAAKVSGMAHSGMTNIPTEGTYLLDGGERIVQPEQNRDLGNFLRAVDLSNSGSSGSAEPPVASVTFAPQLLDTNGLDLWYKKNRQKIARHMNSMGRV